VHLCNKIDESSVTNNYFYDELVIKYVMKILPNHRTPRGPIKRGHMVEPNLAMCHLKMQRQ
jgi:hypothetical protein